MTLTEYLRAYAQTMLPMHMPGGKRVFPSALPYALDVTEVEGTDDLHDPQGVLARLQEQISSLWGAEHSFVLVGGSTCGLLAAVRATGDGAVLLARNCHKSVYNAVELCRRAAYYVLPEQLDGSLYGEISPQAVEQALALHADVTTVILTSPTYEGVVSDIRAIAELCRRKNVSLIVDEAHGAHFPFHPYFPESAVGCGADIVVQSLHKTLPALTQTALLHGKTPFAGALQRELAVFETSSPSYILLCSASECACFLESEAGGAAFASYTAALERVRSRLKRELSCFSLLETPRYDKGKLVILTDRSNLTGTQLAKQLREGYAIETEYASPYALIAMSSVCDTEETLSRFADAVLAVDRTAKRKAPKPPLAFSLPERVLFSFEARSRTGVSLPLAEAVGRVSLETVWAYPPGIPLLVAGERVEASFLQAADRLAEAGIHLRGCEKEGYLLVEP